MRCRLGGHELAVALGDELVEVRGLGLDPIVGQARAPLAGVARGELEQDRAVGEHPGDREVVDGAHGGDPEGASRSLVGERAVDEAVGHDVRSARERGRDDLVDGLGSRGGVQQRLGAGPDGRLGIEQHEGAHALADGRAAGLAQLDHLVPTLAQPGRVQARLGGLAGAVDALEADKGGCCDPGTLPSATAKEPAAAGEREAPMPGYVVYRPSVMRSGRLGVRAAAVAALVLAAGVAFVVLTHTGGQSNGSPSAHATRATASPSRVKGAHTTTHDAQGGREASGPQAGPPGEEEGVVIPAPAHTPVAVLNGGTATGAAAALAGRLRSLGYPVPVVGNAGRRDLPMSIEYAAGLGPAARALARRLGPVRYVTPFDGPARNLSGARLLVIIGN